MSINWKENRRESKVGLQILSKSSFIELEPTSASRRDRKMERDKLMKSSSEGDDASAWFTKWLSTSELHSDFCSEKCDLQKVS